MAATNDWLLVSDFSSRTEIAYWSFDLDRKLSDDVETDMVYRAGALFADDVTVSVLLGVFKTQSGFESFDFHNPHHEFALRSGVHSPFSEQLLISWLLSEATLYEGPSQVQRDSAFLAVADLSSSRQRFLRLMETYWSISKLGKECDQLVDGFVGEWPSDRFGFVIGGRGRRLPFLYMSISRLFISREFRQVCCELGFGEGWDLCVLPILGPKRKRLDDYGFLRTDSVVVDELLSFSPADRDVYKDGPFEALPSGRKFVATEVLGDGPMSPVARLRTADTNFFASSSIAIRSDLYGELPPEMRKDIDFEALTR